MTIPRLPRINVGGTPTAAGYNRAVAEIERAHRLRGIAPLQVQFDATGFTLYLDTTTVLSWTLPDGTTLEEYIASSAGSSLTVAEEDGSPSYTDTTTLIVNQDEGLTLSQPGTGQVMVSNACLVRASLTDTTPNYLAGKLAVVNGILSDLLGGGGDESIRLQLDWPRMRRYVSYRGI